MSDFYGRKKIFLLNLIMACLSIFCFVFNEYWAYSAAMIALFCMYGGFNILINIIINESMGNKMRNKSGNLGFTFFGTGALFFNLINYLL